jgi:hypothetical protein
MDRFAGHVLSTVLCLGLAAGCGKSESSGTAPAADASTQQREPPPTDPAARVAYDFLDAVLKGDDQKVSACLTPQAIQRLIDSHKRFALPGVDSTTFRIGEVRKPSESQALVQCILSDSSPSKEAQSEEICCLVRQIESEWRVSGIAVLTAPGRLPMILDFESPPSEPMGLPTSPQLSNGPSVPGTEPMPGSAVPVASPGRLSPPRTAEDKTLPSFR